MRLVVPCAECGRELRATVERAARGRLLCGRCRDLTLVVAEEPDESVRAWARRVWTGWSPAERAEVAGALESLHESLIGAGDGEMARHRRRVAA